MRKTPLSRLPFELRVGGWATIVVLSFGITPTTGFGYDETFDGGAVPGNWTAQNGSAGTATLGIVDDTAGIGAGNALSVVSATRQGVIGQIPEFAFANVGDSIELRFDVRLTDFPNNAGGFRFGLYHDNGGSGFSSGYRALLGTGTSYLSTDIQADGGDTDIGFGTNRENPPGYQSNLPGINDNNPHSMAFILNRTANGVEMNVLQDGTPNFSAPVEHVMGEGTGTPIEAQTAFNQIMFTTNGGYEGFIDNVTVNYFVPGDVTGDGFVNDDDFDVILGAMFTNVSLRTQGDLSGDGFVDFADYRIWKDTPKTNPGAIVGSIPEPSGGALMGLLIGIGVAARKRWKVRDLG
ncbi:PEP-CTERM sorting domain-containing protein [Aeoliella sp.]|uniref:PEP-CTERM sorting domain-containing protein n=1 Tax=Aeoliella sp. TaxID=2795800 RepID=UPI003CCC128E